MICLYKEFANNKEYNLHANTSQVAIGEEERGKFNRNWSNSPRTFEQCFILFFMYLPMINYILHIL